MSTRLSIYHLYINKVHYKEKYGIRRLMLSYFAINFTVNPSIYVHLYYAGQLLISRFIAQSKSTNGSSASGVDC